MLRFFASFLVALCLLTAPARAQIVLPGGASGGAGGWPSNCLWLNQWPGITIGIGTSGAVHTANATALDAALAYANTNNLYICHPGGSIEYYSTDVQGSTPTGPQVLSGVRGVIGSDANDARFVQFAPGYPCITIGDLTTSTILYYGRFENISCGFGVQNTAIFQGSISGTTLTVSSLQSGVITAGMTFYTGANTGTTIVSGSGTSWTVSSSQTQSAGTQFVTAFAGGIAIQWGNLAYSYLNLVKADPYAGNLGYRVEAYIGMSFGNNGNTGFFSNVAGLLYAGTGVQNFFYFNAITSGNVWGNIYCGGGGTGNLRIMAGYPFYVENATNFGTIALLNIEWTSQNANLNGGMLSLSNVEGMYIDQLRFEGNSLVGYNPSWVGAAISTLTVGTLNLYNETANPANISGTAYVTSSYSKSLFKILSGVWDDWPGGISPTIGLFSQDNSSGEQSRVTFTNIQNRNFNGTLNPDANVTQTMTGPLLDFKRYEWNSLLSEFDGATINYTGSGGTLNVPGFMHHTRVECNAAISSELDIIDMNFSGASGAPAAFGQNYTDILEVWRSGSCTGASNVVIKDSTGTTTIKTLSSTGTTGRAVRYGTTLTGF